MNRARTDLTPTHTFIAGWVLLAAMSVISKYYMVIGVAIPLLLPVVPSQLENPHGATIIVGENIQVSADRPERPHVEPQIAVDPRNPKHLIAATIAFTRSDASFTCAVFTSFDAGKRWVRSDLSSLYEMQLDFAADPWTAFGRDGTVYFSCIASRTDTALALVFRSTDGGRRWSKPSAVPNGKGGAFDRSSILVDMTGGQFDGRVYVIASQTFRTQSGIVLSQPVVSCSTNGGVSFSEPVRIDPNNLNNNVTNAVILADGTLILTFMDFMSSTYNALNTRRLWVAISRDGGRTFSVPYFVSEFVVPDVRVRPASGSCQGLAVDQSSGPYQSRLYMVWNTVVSDATEIQVSYSTDKGETWSRPVRVDDNANKNVDHATPAIAIDQRGIVGVAWYDRRADPANVCSEIYFAASLDGGKTFLPNVRVSTARSCPGTIGNTVPSSGGDSAGVARRWPAGGDYSGFAASTDQLFHVLWSDSRTGVYQNWTASINVVRQDSSKPATAPKN